MARPDKFNIIITTSKDDLVEEYDCRFMDMLAEEFMREYSNELFINEKDLKQISSKSNLITRKL